MHKPYSLLALLLTFCSLLDAQNIEFNHITPDDGLSQISVNSLYADRDGLIWVATRVGLNSYDGNSIQVYQHQAGNAHSLFSNSVVSLTGNGIDKLYLLCAEGVASLDLPTRRFTTLRRSNNMGAICYSRGLYVGEGNKVCILSEATPRQLRTIVHLPAGQYVTSLTVDSQQRLWIGTQSNGVYCYARRRLTHPIAQGTITQIYEDSRHRLWVGSWNHGFWLIDPQGRIVNYRDLPQLPSNFVRTFCEDSQGRIWMGTYLGLVCYTPSTQQWQTFTAQSQQGSLTDSSIWSIIRDAQGTLWLGTYFGGVNYFNPEYEIYTQYRVSDTPGGGLSSPIVGRMTEDNFGKLWICTEGGGLNVYDRRTKRFTWYGYPGSMISQKNLKCIHFDSLRNVLWVGTHLGGLDRIDLTTRRSRFYRHRASEPGSLPSDIVRDIRQYGRLLIIATQGGVVMMDPETDRFTPLLSREHLKTVQSLCIDRQQRLWIATEANGVYCYDLRRHTYRHFVHTGKPGSVSSNNINNVLLDRRGRIWLSTGSAGIDLFVKQGQRFVNYGRQHGLAGGCVYTAASSSLNADHLLLITNQGFSVFDIKSETFRNFNKSNGFPLATVNENALYVASDGTVFLGGVQGMVSFRERDLYKRSKPYHIGFGRLFVNGHEVQPDDDSQILSKALSHTDKIQLHRHQSVVSIQIYTSNYIKENAAPLRYRLLGLSDQWLPVRQDQTTLDFSSLPPGSYTLELGTTRPDIATARLHLSVLPPWYRSWWAWLIYLVAAALGTWWLVREYRDRIRLAESLKYEQQHVKDIEERNQSKIRLFTNVSHEIRTPLTVIIGLSESLLKSRTFTTDIYNKLLGIYRNSDQLRELISELLDFRKQEMTHPSLHVQQRHWVPFVQGICGLFSDYALSRDLSMVFKPGIDAEVWFDYRQMKKVVSNLVSNALKHTPQGGVVTVTAAVDASSAVLSVTDTGPGIAPGDLDAVFGRFYQGKEIESLTEMGTGIGLHLTQTIVEQHHGHISVSSVVGEGTTFTVTLPLGNSHFAETEIDSAIVTESAPMVPEPLLEKPVATDTSLHGQPSGVATPQAVTGATILIVEDNDDIRQLLNTLFSPMYRTLMAVDGREALEIVRDELPDIVLSDVLMPNMSGTELCRAIKQDFTICHIPVVLLTARTAEEQALEGLKIGADDYVTKPFSNDLLVSRCNNLVNNRRMLQRKFSEHPHAEADMLASNPLDKAMLDRAMAIIDQHYTDSRFSVDIFAREIGMSRTALFTKWKTLTGQTPKEFIMNLRLRKAARELRANRELSIADISYRNGFSSPRYFCKCFKDLYQQQPSTYRNATRVDETDNYTE